MGRQICFYVTQKDADTLIEQIYLQGAMVVDFAGRPLQKEELQSITDNDYCQKHFESNKFFVMKPSLSLYYHSNAVKESIDEMKAEVIEFSLCRLSPAKIIDTSSVDNNFRKNGFVVINDSDEYNKQMNELMKNPVYIDNPNYVEHGFEHGRFWYTSEFFDDEGRKIKKSKEIDTLFNSLSKFIKNNFMLSKDRFAYIGAGAYEKYQEGVFIPCSGRNKIVVE